MPEYSASLRSVWNDHSGDGDARRSLSSTTGRVAVSAPRDIPGRPGGDVGDAILAALFTESPIGLHVLDTGLRLVYFNPAARHIRAFPVEELLGCTLSEMLRAFGLEEEEAQGIEALAREVLETGRPRRDVLATLRSPYEPYAEVTASVSWYRLNDARGRPLGVATAIVDVTKRHQAQARLALLHRASNRIGTTLDVFQTAQELADAPAPDFADTTTVDLLDPVLRGEAPEPGPLIEGIALRRAGWHSMHDIKDSRIPMAGEISGFPAGSPYRQAMTDLRPRLISKLDADAAWLAEEPFHYRLLKAVQVRSMIVVPLRARGLVLGLACFYRWRSPDAYQEEDLALAEQLAAHTALCLDNARLYSRSRSAACLLQMNPRPLEIPTHSAVETAHCYPPSSSGGDWADVIPLPGARVALATGTVTGDGIRAAAAMGELRAAIGALAALDLTPDELLQRLHELVTWLSGQEPPPRKPDRAPRPWTPAAPMPSTTPSRSTAPCLRRVTSSSRSSSSRTALCSSPTPRKDQRSGRDDPPTGQRNTNCPRAPSSSSPVPAPNGTITRRRTPPGHWTRSRPSSRPAPAHSRKPATPSWAS